MHLRRLRVSLALSLTALAPACSASAPAPDDLSTSAAQTVAPDNQVEIQGSEGLCINYADDGQGNPTMGKPVHLGSCEAVASITNTIVTWRPVKLRIVNVGGGLIEIHPDIGSGCLDVTGGVFKNGTPIQMLACNGTTSQRFSFMPIGDSDNPYGELYHPGSGKCIDVQWSGASGSGLRLWDCPATSESWLIGPGYQWGDGRWFGLPDGPYTFATDSPSSCMDVRGASSVDGTPLQVYSCNGTVAQTFTVQNVAPGGVFNLKILGKCVDIQNAAIANGTPIQIYDCNGTNAQKFILDYRGVLCTPDASYCIDRPYDNKTNGTALQLYQRNSTYAQSWNPNRLPNPTCSAAGCQSSTFPTTLVPDDVSHEFANAVHFSAACPDSLGRRHVYRSADGGATWSVMTWFGPGIADPPCDAATHSRHYVDTTAAAGTTYQYRLLTTATMFAGEMPPQYRWTAPLAIAVTNDTSPPAPPSLAVTSAGPSQVSLRITDESTNEVSFRVYAKGPNDASYVLQQPAISVANPPNVATGATYAWTLSSPVPFAQYDFIATAVGATGVESDKGAPGAHVTALTEDPPLPVANLAVAATSPTSVQVSWTPAEVDDTSFTVQQTSPTTTPATTVFTPSYAASGLVTGQTYCFTVTAWRAQIASTAVTACGAPN